MQTPSWRWTLGMIHVVAVAVIWVGASFVVQSVVDKGVSPFLLAYIGNCLFIVYIPIVEGRRFLESCMKRKQDRATNSYRRLRNVPRPLEFLDSISISSETSGVEVSLQTELEFCDDSEMKSTTVEKMTGSSFALTPQLTGAVNKLETSQGGQELLEITSNEQIFSRKQTALISLAICPFWFAAQFTFNLSLTYTTVTSNTVLSTTSSIFTFLISLRFLGEQFTWFKLASLLLCSLGSVTVSLADSLKIETDKGNNAVWGDVLCVISAVLYAIYTTLLRGKIPDEREGKRKVSTALLLGYLGLINGLLFLPVALIMHFSGVEPFQRLKPSLLGVIVAKGMLDNVLSDYLWAQAVLLTTPTAASAGLTIQVPIAAIVDSVRVGMPCIMNVIGAIAVLIGFFGINKPASTTCVDSLSCNELDHGETLELNSIN